MDVLAVEEAARRLAGWVRAGEGPQFLEIRTYRFRAHSMADPDLYRTKEEIARWQLRDPIAIYCERLQREGLLAAADVDTIEREVAAEIAQAVEFAEAGAWEPVESLMTDVTTPR
jgi:TPP-dependent pyruvate/acetoin dehydrogenase alpha subunit